MARAEKEDDSRTNKGEIIHHSVPTEPGDPNLSMRVLAALDSVPGYDLENSETVIFDNIDLDALDELFRSADESPRRGHVTFPVDRYEVTVTANGEVTVTE